MATCNIEINDLPIEIIMKIVGFLDKSALQRAILTCKLWKNVIESSCPWSLKLNCAHLNHKNSPRCNFLTTTGRKIKIVELTGPLSNCGVSTAIDVLRRHSLHIIELRFVDVRLNDLSTLAQILNCLPNLIELTVSRGFRMNYYLSELLENELPVLSKLKTLRIIATIDCRFLMCLKKVEVKTLKVIDSSDRHFYNSDIFEDFLIDQNQNTSHSTQFSIHPLARWSLHYGQLVKIGYSNPLKFIEEQVLSLKELELGYCCHHAIYECVFAKMTNLETLHLMISDILGNAEMLGRLKENRNIKNLIIKEAQHTFGLRRFRDFLKCLPNVANVTILGKSYPKDIVEVIAKNLPQLKVLHVSKCQAEFCGIHFPKLNALHIGDLKGKMDWQIFSKAHPQLTEFTLETFDDVNWYCEIEKMTKANIRLSTLRFGEWFKADTRSLEVLRINCPKLKALELHKNCAVLDEPYDQLWTSVLRFRQSKFQSSFWSGDEYDFLKKLGIRPT